MPNPRLIRSDASVKQPDLIGIYGEPIALHGLRAMAVCEGRMDGLTHREIAAQLCMSIGKVMHYSKHIDAEALAQSANRKEKNGSRIDRKKSRLGMKNENPKAMIFQIDLL